MHWFNLIVFLGVDSILNRAIKKGSTEAVSTIVDCWISSLNSECMDAGSQLYWHPFHFFSLHDLNNLSVDYPEMCSKLICSLQLLTANSCTLAKIKVESVVQPRRTGLSVANLANMSAKIAPVDYFSSVNSVGEETVTSKLMMASTSSGALDNEYTGIGFIDLESKRMDELHLGEAREFMVGISSNEGIAMWTSELMLERSESGGGSSQPVTPIFLPLQGAATLDMLKLFVSLSNTLETTDIFDSHAGKLCLQYAWDTAGSQAHLSMLLSYLLFVLIYSVAVFAFQSLLDISSPHSHRLAWALQLCVLAFMALYFIKQVITYMNNRGETLWSFLFDNVWNIQDFISFFLVTAGMLLRLVSGCETDDSRDVLAIASLFVWFKCLYYMRAYEGSGPLGNFFVCISYYCIPLLYIILLYSIIIYHIIIFSTAS